MRTSNTVKQARNVGNGGNEPTSLTRHHFCKMYWASISNILIFAKMITVGLFLSIPSTAQALEFNITWGESVPSNELSDLKLAAETASDNWKEIITDDVTINITFEWTATFQNQAEGARASVLYLPYSYTEVRDALEADMTTANDTNAVNAMPLNSIPMLINLTSDNPNGSGSSTPYLDDNSDQNNTRVRVSLANAKSMGLFSAHHRYKDGTITVSGFPDWDADPSNGIDPLHADLVAVLTHEIGHVLGVSTLIEGQLAYNPGKAAADYDFVSPEDLFRYSAESIANGYSVIDWSSDSREKFFSIDGGRTEISKFSTGSRGDGSDPSHWQHDTPTFGIMDPQVSPLHMISDADLTLLDVMGWNVEYQKTGEPVEVPVERPTEEPIEVPVEEPEDEQTEAPVEEPSPSISDTLVITETVFTATYIEIRWSTEALLGNNARVMQCNDLEAADYQEATGGLYRRGAWRKYFSMSTSQADACSFRVEISE